MPVCKPRPARPPAASGCLTAGRRLDTTGAFAAYDVPGTSQIGAAGTTLWFSVLVDRQTAVGGGQTPTSIDFTNNAIAWNDSSPQFGVGYYGSSSDSGGNGYWSLMVGGTVVKSTTPITVGTHGPAGAGNELHRRRRHRSACSSIPRRWAARLRRRPARTDRQRHHVQQRGLQRRRFGPGQLDRRNAHRTVLRRRHAHCRRRRQDGADR